MQIKKKYSRLITLILGISIFTTGVIILLNYSSKNIMFYLEVSDLKNQPNQYQNKLIQIGGLVAPKSLSFDKKTEKYSFIISDCHNQVQVIYQGVLPSLFRDGQGIIAKGKYVDQVVYADTLLTKHDEYYAPKKQAKISFCGEILKY